jgi:hypothetical protein
MRSHALILPLILIGALAAGPALGATYGDKPKRRPTLPPPPSDLRLRGPIAAAPPSVLPPSPALHALPAPGAVFAGLSTAGLATPPAITPLRPIGDPAPICRAQCAETRYVCATTDDLDCDSHWSQCVADCSAPTLQ